MSETKQPDLTTSRGRLEHLITVLERVEARIGPGDEAGDQFDMSDWYSPPGDGCGTSACALGWAALDPDFQSVGVGIDDQNITFGTGRGCGAATYLFGISRVEAERLFMPAKYDAPSHDITPSDVILRIHQVLRRMLSDPA